MKSHGVVIIALIAIAVLGIAYSQLSPNLAPRVYSQCITPPVYPQMIMQSGKICSGTYNYGIGIGANNVKINCQAGTSFNGAGWNGLNGLTIINMSNVTVQGCSFSNFNDGIYLEGQPNAFYSSKEIYLLNLVSRNNNGNGIYIGQNVENVTLKDSNITSNNFEGILLTSNYFGLVSAAASMFPDKIKVLNNQITNNGNNGIYLNQLDYFAHTPGVISVNNSVEIVNNFISHNMENGIKNTGADASASSILRNYINNNGISGISIRGEKSINLVNNSNFTYFYIRSSFGNIALNDLIGNGQDGLQMYSTRLSNVNSAHNVNPGNVYGNFIENNGRNGINYDAEDYSTSHLGHFIFYANILQNDITNNGREGFYFDEGANFTSGLDTVMPLIRCNDILSNGGGTASGIKIKALYISHGTFWIFDENIILWNRDNNVRDG